MPVFCSPFARAISAMTVSTSRGFAHNLFQADRDLAANVDALGAFPIESSIFGGFLRRLNTALHQRVDFPGDDREAHAR
jgi:hypothetical protein